MAKVVNVDYEEGQVSLRTIIGASGTYQRVSVPTTFPGAGMRHFFGAMPEIGDQCIVGWTPQESSEKGGGTKTPVILAWISPGTSFGRDWATVSDFSQHEFDMSSPRSKSLTSGAYSMTRIKMRHLHPGNILASSSQGSDIMLDEGVLIANRRGNEIRIRDQDQAIVMRSLQQFHAMAGARVYAGMVQRDATFLPKTMISDGKVWDDTNQSVNGQPFTDSSQDLADSTSAPRGFLSPAAAMARSRGPDGMSRPTLVGSSNIDPYSFLARGSFINESGFAVDDKHASSGYYGGKSIYRVASSGKSNTVTNADLPTFTEYRIEINHTSDGRLPVTEQTDMFDADRLPQSNPGSDPKLPPPNVPFIEWSMGSVIGNDAFSPEGRKKYGMPLVARIFEGDVQVPRLDAANIGTSANSGSTPVGEHMASLFRMTPPVSNTESTGTFWGVNKSGQLKASIGGNPNDFSAEVAMAGSMKIGLGGGMRFISDGHIEWVTRNKSSLDLRATSGSVRIYGGGPVKSNSAPGERNNGTDNGEGDIPAVEIIAKTNTLIKADRLVAIKAGTATVSATTVNITANGELTLDGAAKTSISTDAFQMHVNGKAQESYGGPKYGLITNMPLHERTYTPSQSGVCERVTYTLGDREEIFTIGNHKTSIKIGNMTYETDQGEWVARASTSKISMDSGGITATASAGDTVVHASSGQAQMIGFSGALVSAPGGTATVSGSAGVYLGGPITGTDAGPIVCAGSIEPFTGLPFSTWGVGAKNHIVGA